MESNDSPEIPDRGETSDISGLPKKTAGIFRQSKRPKPDNARKMNGKAEPRNKRFDRQGTQYRKT